MTFLLRSTLIVWATSTLLQNDGLVFAQDVSADSESTCSVSRVISIPSRPSLASGTDTTQCGTLEAEYGLESQWLGGGTRHDDLTGGLRFGVLPNLDLHWASGHFLNFADPNGRQRGFGDTWLGFKYRYLKQTSTRPSLGVFYQAKIPSADSRKGLGSGRVDHSIALLVSKDVGRFHLDFNAIPTLIGRQAGGFDHNVGFALATTLPVTRRLSVVAEPYGYSAQNSTTPGLASVMFGTTYQANPRLVLDTGVDAGVTHGAPQKRVYVGVTSAIGNVYSSTRPTRVIN